MPGESALRFVDTDAAWRATLSELSTQPRYGVDTEFHRERTYYPELLLVQLSWPGHVALVDPLAVDIGLLRELFDRGGVAVMHAASQDLEILAMTVGEVPSRLFDVQVAAAFCGYAQVSLVELARDTLNVELSKGDRLTDWSRRPLGKREQQYAADDVAYLLELQDALSARLSRGQRSPGNDRSDDGRLAWAEEECERVRCVNRHPQDPETAWWKLKGRTKLRGRTRGIAQSVAAWRERRAQQQNVPVRTVLSDLAMAGIVQRSPRTEPQLRGIRGIEARHLRDRAASEILDAVRSGEQLESTALRLPETRNVKKAGRATVAICQAVVAELAAEYGIDPSLLGTRDELETFAAAALDGQELAGGRLSSGWRAGIVGEPLVRLLKGELAVTCAGPDRLRLVPAPSTALSSFPHIGITGGSP